MHQTKTWGIGINKKDFTVNTANNRLGVPGGQSGTMSYDSAGNLTTDTYTGNGGRTYDAENRMIAAQGVNQSNWQYYTYNADGQRVRRKVDGVETWQVYGIDGELLAEYPATGAVATPQKEYGYRNGQLLVTGEAAVASGANVAAAANGASVSASSTVGSQAAANAINGDRKGLSSGWWADNTSYTYPDWLQVDFAGSKSINEINVIGLQQNYGSPVEPTLTMTSSYALTNFEVQYWTGSAWAAVPGGTVTGNDKVWRKLSFPTLTTSKIRLYVTSVAGDNRSQVVELEASGQPTFNWLVADQLGTPRMVLDKTGSLAGVERHDYLPFGEELFAGTGGRTGGLNGLGYDGDTVRQKFTSYERDNETGLDYARARYFSSSQGRFTSVDPIMITKRRLTDPQSINLYAYTRNNPLKYVDPTGEYFVGTNGKRVGFRINDKGKIVLGRNASADLVRQARLINKTGSETALAQFSASATNETKNHFKIESKEVKNGLLGLHQAHDKNGKPLNWPIGADKFDGQPAYIKNKDGNMVYKEATITVYEGNITKDQLEAQQRINADPALTKSEVIVGVFSHEVDHNTNQEAIDAIRDRQEGRPNNLDVEQPAERVERQVFEEIKKKRP